MQIPFDFLQSRLLKEIMRRYFVGGISRSGHKPYTVFVAVSLFLSLTSLALADTFYEWRDDAGRVSFSNSFERAPSNAQVVRLPELNMVTRPPLSDAPSPSAESPSMRATVDQPAASPSGPSACGAPDASRLIKAITSRLESVQSGVSAESRLTREQGLWVAATPIWYSSDANLVVLPGGDSGETAASEQVAVAYPRGSACPSVPLERYAAVATERSDSSGLCADYQRASTEVETAASRNEIVTRTLRFAATRFDSFRADGSLSEAGRLIPSGSDLAQGTRLSPWLVELNAASTAELADEVNEFSEELAVAREEIDRAARAQGCW